VSDALARALYRLRVPLSVLVLAGAVALTPRTSLTNIDNDLTAWFSRADPVFQDYERFRTEFGGTRTLIIALAGETIFSEPGFAFLRRASSEIERVPTVQRVHSLATANVVQAWPASGDDPGGIEVRPLVERTGAIDPAAVRRRAQADPLIGGELVSADGRVTAIIVSFDEDRIDEVRGATIERIHQIVDPQLPPGVEALYNGSLEISETYNRVTLDNVTRYTPPMVAIMCLAIYTLFRSVRRTAVIVFSALVSVVWTLGLYSLLGFTYNVLSSMIAPLVTVLAVADDVHIVQHYDQELRRTGRRDASFIGSVSHLALPLLGASGTTALGLLSLATSDVVAVKTFGLGAAIGVMVDFAISLVFVPTLLGWAGPPPAVSPPQERWLVGPMRAVARFATMRPRTVILAAAALGAVALAGMMHLRVDTNHINFFSEGHPLHRSADVIDRELSGVYSFQVLLEGSPDAMKSPAMLRRIEEYGRALERLPFVRKVTSLPDYVKRVNRELHDGDPAAALIPETADAVAQELLVFSLSDEGRRELERIVSSDYSRTQVSVKLASMSSDDVFRQIHEAARLAQECFHGIGVSSTVTGAGRLFSTLDHYLVASQVSSFGTAFFTVFAVIFLIFRSFRYGLLAIAPNVFPVLAVLGVMGWLDISMNVATVMLASVALGVVDDDTIHFINRYRREIGVGRSTVDAIEIATVQEGRASLTTAIINSASFGILMVSEYRPNAWFGGLLALTMAVAFLAEVFIVPATIRLLPAVFSAERMRYTLKPVLPSAPASHAREDGSREWDPATK
jgi:predicted RND superfamily exporter protein